MRRNQLLLKFNFRRYKKVAIDAMEPPPKDGGVRFAAALPGFVFDDPFLGGVTRSGLALVPL
jgi:hypothetical protein